MYKYLLIVTATAAIVTGCASPEVAPVKQEVESKKNNVQKPVVQPDEKLADKQGQDPIEKKSLVEKDAKFNLCDNIKSLKKGMTLEEVHNNLGMGDDKKHSFTKPIFYVKCFEGNMMISYAEFKFFFDEGCVFRKVYEPDEEGIKEKVCSGRTEILAPPEIIKY